MGVAQRTCPKRCGNSRLSLRVSRCPIAKSEGARHRSRRYAIAINSKAYSVAFCAMGAMNAATFCGSAELG